MIKKKILSLALIAGMVAGSSMVVHAATCPPHSFIKETYSSTYYEPASHTYLYATYEDGTEDYRVCNYEQGKIILNLVCCYCDLDSGTDKIVTGAQRGHVCGK